jgi:hypothetical protein
MGFVLVPVPADHVYDVMRWVLLRAPDEEGANSGRDEARITELMSEVDELDRDLLLAVARAATKNEQVRLRDVADDLGETPGDVSARVRQLNQRAFGVGGRVVIKTLSEVEIGVTGNRGYVTYLAMHPDVAQAIRAAGRGAASAE